MNLGEALLFLQHKRNTIAHMKLAQPSSNQSGFAVIEVVIVIVVLLIIGFVAFRVLDSKDSSSPEDSANNPAESAQKSEIKIKHLGINLEEFDPATGMAGDLKFTKFKFPEGSFDTIFVEYGRREPNNSAEGNSERYNPQPTFLAPLGTKVYALIDGTVYDVPKLYSDDYSVQLQGEGSDYIFELEHVINVMVKKGDRVKAGDVVAEVSDYNGDKLDGLGLVEIGVLIPGNPPKHACTFDFLDDSIKEVTLNKIRALQTAWEKYRGNPNVYDEATQPVPGCANRNLVEG